MNTCGIHRPSPSLKEAYMNGTVKQSKTERPTGSRAAWCNVWLTGALAVLFLAPAADGVGKKDRVHAFGDNPAFELLAEDRPPP